MGLFMAGECSLPQPAKQQRNWRLSSYSKASPSSTQCTMPSDRQLHFMSHQPQLYPWRLRASVLTGSRKLQNKLPGPACSVLLWHHAVRVGGRRTPKSHILGMPRKSSALEAGKKPSTASRASCSWGKSPFRNERLQHAVLLTWESTPGLSATCYGPFAPQRDYAASSGHQRKPCQHPAGFTVRCLQANHTTDYLKGMLRLPLRPSFLS